MRQIATLVTAGILLVVLGIVLSIGAEITGEIEADVSDIDAKLVVQNTTEGLLELASWQDTISLVLAAAVIISLVFGAFAFRGKGM